MLYFHGKWQNHFTHKFISIFIIWRNWIYITHLARSLQINGGNKPIANNILPLFKASSWIYWLNLYELNLGSQIYLLSLRTYRIRKCRLPEYSYTVILLGYSSIQHTKFKQLNTAKQVFLNMCHFSSTLILLK